MCQCEGDIAPSCGLVNSVPVYEMLAIVFG